MEVNKKEVRNCLTCELYEEGCEENCPFELEQEMEPPTLRNRRRNMKAEKAKAYAKAMQKLNSAENKATVTTRYEKSKNNSNDIKEDIEYQEDMHEIKKGDLVEEYPKVVFTARAEAIKQAKRKLRRQEKNEKK